MHINGLPVDIRPLPKRLGEFITYLPAMRGLADNTLIAYTNDLMSFFRFSKISRGLVSPETPLNEIVIQDIDDSYLQSITESELIQFVGWCKQVLKNSEKTRGRKIGTLKVFFTYLHKKARILNENPAIDLDKPKVGKRKPVYLSYEESRALLSAINGKRNMERDYCIITLFLNCGIRRSELCNINLDNIRDGVLRLIGKGNKERYIPLNNACLRAIEEYMPAREEMLKGHLVDTDTKRALFLSERRQRIGPRTVGGLVEKYITLAGLDSTKYSTHKLRHTAATLMYQAGADIVSLQQLLGHDNISTTQIYVHTVDEQLKNAININPLANERKN